MTKRSPKTIVLMVPTLSHSVEFNLTVGAASQLAGDEYHLLHMTVGWIEPDQAGKGHATKLHRALNTRDIAGIIVYGAGITNRGHPDDINEIMACYPDIPIINVGNIASDYPSLIVENRTPVRKLIRHLVSDRGCRHIALINGPEHNYDANERRQGVLEGLAEFGLTLPPELDWPGLFGVSSGSFALSQYFKSHTEPPDAVVCANDLMAIGAQQELISRGFRIPEDVIVTGFDDLEYSKDIPVPLSTVRYPIHAMGKLAAELLKAWIETDKIPPAITEIGCSVVLRKSSGENDSPNSQLAESAIRYRHYFSRDSNTDRLHISRAFNAINNIAQLMRQGRQLIYNIGGRQLHVFQCAEGSLDIEHLYSTIGDVIKVYHQPESPVNPLDLNYFLGSTHEETINWVMAPVQWHDHFFGFVLLAVLPNESDTVEFLANELSRYFENQRLEAERTALRSQVLKAEQMATLGRMVGGIAHELNTPLGSGLVAVTNLTEETRQINRLREKNLLTKTAFEHYLDVCDETQKILYSTLKRSADLVSSFKQVSVDQHIDEERKVNLSEYIDEVLLSLKPRFSRNAIRIETNFPDQLTVKTYAGAIAQIISNLLLNSLMHGFNDGQTSGHIKVTLNELSHDIELVVEDDGEGISVEKQPKIFDPFFTSKRHQGGTGLGLHIVYNLVTQKLSGHISLESHPKFKGSRFIVTLPKTK